MKLFKLSIIFLLTMSIISCGDDEEVVCTQADWLGTYTGTATCDGTTDDATVTITASGVDAIVIRYVTGNTTTVFDPLTVEGCSIENSSSLGGVTGSVSATLNGDDFSLEEIVSGGGFNINCTVSATRD